MAVPKRKTSKSRRDKRRTHQKIDTPNLGVCTNCQEPILPHTLCTECGYYNGRVIIEPKEDE